MGIISRLLGWIENDFEDEYDGREERLFDEEELEEEFLDEGEL